MDLQGSLNCQQGGLNGVPYLLELPILMQMAE